MTSLFTILSLLLYFYLLGIGTSKLLKVNERLYSLLGFVVFLSFSFVISILNTLIFNDFKIFSYLSYGIFIGASSLYAIYLIYQNVNNQRKKLLKELILIVIIAIFVSLTYQYYVDIYPHMLGNLQNGTNYISLINNNFYNNHYLNLNLSTGKLLNSYVIETHLGFYAIVDFVLKAINTLKPLISPIPYAISISNQLILNLIIQIYAYFIIKAFKEKRLVNLTVASSFLALMLGDITFNYGYVSYVYLPIVCGCILYLLALNNNVNSINIVMLLFSLMAISVNGWIYAGILLIIYLIIKYLFNNQHKVKNNYFWVFIFLCVVAVLPFGFTNIFKHLAFEFGYEYLVAIKNLIVLCVPIYFVAICMCSRSKVLLSLVLVLNPLVITLIFNNVYQGFSVLDLLFNFGFIYIVFTQLENYLNEKNISIERVNTIFIGMSILAMYVNTNMNEDTFQLNGKLNTDDYVSYSKEYRIDNESKDLFYILNEQTKYAKDRVKIISQHPLTNSFVSNVELLYDRDHINNLCQYCNVIDENIHEPDKLTNIFDYREYADNTLYIEKPSYENACHLLSDNDYQYIVVGTDQYVNVNGNYINYSDLLSNCASVIFQNDAYMLLKVN